MDEPAGDPRPAGVPINCVARVRPPAEGGGGAGGAAAAVLVDGKAVRVRGGEGAGVTFGEVYGPAATQEDLFAREAPRVLRAAVQGYSAAVLCLGQAGSGRSHTLFGQPGEGRPGLAALSGRRLFELLKARVEEGAAKAAAAGAGAADRSRYDHSRGSFEVRAQFVEAAGDAVRDLLAAAPVPDLDVECGEAGPYVPGATSRAVHHADDLEELIAAGLAARTAEHTDFGPMRPRASAFLTLEIEQRAAPALERLYSRLTFCVMPGTGALAEDADRLRAREGPRLNREALAFGALVRRLGSPRTADFADYSISKTTALLDDVLGGNCVTLCVATLRPEDAAVSRVTLEYARLLQRVSNYPLLNDERAQGLLRRMRLQVFHLRQELEHSAAAADGADGGAGGAGGAGAGDGTAETARAVVDLKSRLLRSDLDRAALAQEKQRVLERFGEFRARYTELVQSKAELQEALIEAEEERLKASRLLVDLQIEATSVKEGALTEKYELEARLLALENTKVERELEEQSARDERERLAEELRKAEEERKNVSLEYVALRKNYAQLVDEKKQQTSDVSEMAVELLSLSNARRTLEAQARDLEARAARLEEENAELLAYRNDTASGSAARAERAAKAEAELERLRVELVRRDVVAAQERTEAEARKAELERQYVQLAMERGKELEALQETLRGEREAAAAAAAEAERLRGEAAMTASLARRRDAAHEAALAAAEAEAGELAARVEELEAAAQREHNEFRDRVAALMSDLDEARDAALRGCEAGEFEVEPDELGQGGGGAGGADGAGGAGGAGGDADGVEDPLAGTLGQVMDRARAELAAAHRRREEELRAECDRRAARVRRLAADNRRLAARARSLAAALRDVVPAAVRVPELDEAGEGADVDGLEEAAREEEAAARRRAEQLEQQLAETRAAADRQGQQALARAEAFQQRCAVLQGENARLRREQQSLARRADAPGGDAIEELRQMMLAHQATGGAAAGDGDAARRVRELEEENARLRGRGPEGAPPLAGGGGGGNAALQRQMKEFQVNTQRRLERERAQLKARATQAEAENERLEEHVRTELLRYQRHIVDLNAKVAYCRDRHGGMQDVGGGGSSVNSKLSSSGAAGARSPAQAW